MSKKGKKGKKKIAGLMLFLGWMIFILLAVVFYFYFFSDLDLRMFNKDKATPDPPHPGLRILDRFYQCASSHHLNHQISL